MAPIADSYEITKGAQGRLERQIKSEVESKFEKLRGDFEQQARIAKAELERKQKEAESEEELKQAENQYRSTVDDALKAFNDTVRDTVKQTIENKPQELIEQMEKKKAEREKTSIEDDVRSHLRGFARTIPSFIMAYGDGKLTLANFDKYTEDNVFLEVTGITEAQFRFLRDGGDYTDPATGETEHFDGHLFNEIVFDDSVAEFWHKKNSLQITLTSRRTRIYSIIFRPKRQIRYSPLAGS